MLLGGLVLCQVVPSWAHTVSMSDSIDFFNQALNSGPLHVGISFFLAGLLLSLTPCTLPMAPILWRAVAGDKAHTPSRLRGVMLSLCFGLGMSLTYTAAGVAAALLGRSLAVVFQSSWVATPTQLIQSIGPALGSAP